LQKRLGNSAPDCAYWAATLLGRSGGEAASAVKSLIQALEQRSELPVHERVVWALGQIGPAASNSVSTLRRIAESNSPRLARLAKSALQQIQRQG
jgi:HEAT repeat protein